jgi:hypothetical protein
VAVLATLDGQLLDFRPEVLDRSTAGRTAVDLLAKLDERQLATGHPSGQSAALLLVGDLHELVRVGQRVFAHRHQLPDLLGCVGQAKTVFEVALVLAQLFRELADAVAVLADHPVVHRSFFERGQVLSLEVLDDRNLEGRVVVELLDKGRDRREAGFLRRPPAALAGNELIAIVAERPDEYRLENAVLADGRRQFVQRLGVEGHPRLLGIGLDPIDGDGPYPDGSPRVV